MRPPYQKKSPTLIKNINARNCKRKIMLGKLKLRLNVSVSSSQYRYRYRYVSTVSLSLNIPSKIQILPPIRSFSNLGAIHELAAKSASIPNIIVLEILVCTFTTLRDNLVPGMQPSAFVSHSGRAGYRSHFHIPKPFALPQKSF